MTTDIQPAAIPVRDLSQLELFAIRLVTVVPVKVARLRLIKARVLAMKARAA